MKPSPEQIARAIAELAAIPFFPSDAGAQLAIMRQVKKFVAGPLELRWLVDKAVGVMRRWQGVPELRGLYCTRFQPLDNFQEYCTLNGFTPDDMEMRHVLEQGQQKYLPPAGDLPLTEADMAEYTKLINRKVEVGMMHPEYGESILRAAKRRMMAIAR